MRSFSAGKTMPLDIGPLHFVGIGGIGMSGIAEIIHGMGYKVQGSDSSESANVQRLRAMGIEVFVGHKAEQVADASAVVISTAIPPENPEVAAAREKGIPVLKRAEMLAELTRLKATVAVAGTHGKTTTTSFVAALLEKGGLEPTVINGGIVNAYGSNVRKGQGDWMVVEADESDGTFIRIPSTVAIITNIDPEHLDHWKNFDALRAAFLQFVQHLPFYGFAVLCIDHPEVQQLRAQITDRRVVTYGFSPQVEVRGVNLKADSAGTAFDVEITSGDTKRVITAVRLPVVGQHNVLNALAAISVAVNLGVSDAAIKEAFLAFKGVKRRFTRTGEVNGITVIDDYGHHPVEIAATLKAARQAAEASKGRVLAVVQPHRYTRVRDLMAEFSTCFNNADAVWVSDIYSAGETPIENVSRETLVAGLRKAGHRDVRALMSADTLAAEIAAEAKPGDWVICLGAGSISAWAYALPEQLEALAAKGPKAGKA